MCAITSIHTIICHAERREKVAFGFLTQVYWSGRMTSLTQRQICQCLQGVTIEKVVGMTAPQAESLGRTSTEAVCMSCVQPT